MIYLGNEQAMYSEIDHCLAQLISIESIIFATPNTGVFIRVVHFISVADGLARYILAQQPGGSAHDRDGFRHSLIKAAQDIMRFGKCHFVEQYWVDLFYQRQFRLAEREEQFGLDRFGRSFTEAQRKREAARLRIIMGSSAVACPKIAKVPLESPGF